MNALQPRITDAPGAEVSMPEDTLTWRRTATWPGYAVPRRPGPAAPLSRFEHTLPGLGERRRRERRRFQAEVLVFPLESRVPCRQASSEDISLRGMFVSSATQYPLGTLVRLRLRTEWGELAVTGRVVHLLEGIGFGCEFVDLGEAQRAALAFLVEASQSQPDTLIH